MRTRLAAKRAQLAPFPLAELVQLQGVWSEHVAPHVGAVGLAALAECCKELHAELGGKRKVVVKGERALLRWELLRWAVYSAGFNSLSVLLAWNRSIDNMLLVETARSGGCLHHLEACFNLCREMSLYDHSIVPAKYEEAVVVAARGGREDAVRALASLAASSGAVNRFDLSELDLFRSGAKCQMRGTAVPNAECGEDEDTPEEARCREMLRLCWSEALPTAAAHGGYLEVLQMLVNGEYGIGEINFTPCPVDFRACVREAAAEGHLEVLKWLYQPWRGMSQLSPNDVDLGITGEERGAHAWPLVKAHPLGDNPWTACNGCCDQCLLGPTAVHLARENGHEKVAEWLVLAGALGADGEVGNEWGGEKLEEEKKILRKETARVTELASMIEVD